MTALKPLNSTTALARFLTLPLLAGALVGCGYASNLPDAPSSLGYELADKPPSVTGNGEVDRLPPPPIARGDAFAKLDAPVEYRASAEVSDEPALGPQDFPRRRVDMTTKTKTPEVESVSDVAFSPLEFEETEGSTAKVDATEFVAPPVQTVAMAKPAPSYKVPAPAPVTSAPMETVVYEPVATQPVTANTVAMNTIPVETVAAPRSPISILRARMSNGAVVSVHPVVGTPGQASATLARTVLAELGTPVNENVARNASVAFDLRGRADRNTDGICQC